MTKHISEIDLVSKLKNIKIVNDNYIIPKKTMEELIDYWRDWRDCDCYCWHVYSVLEEIIKKNKGEK